MRSSLKHTYRQLLTNNPIKARRNTLLKYKNILEEAKRQQKNTQRILKKEGR